MAKQAGFRIQHKTPMGRVDINDVADWDEAEGFVRELIKDDCTDIVVRQIVTGDD